MPSVPALVKKPLWEGTKSFFKKAFLSGTARDETVLKGLVAGRYEARKGMREARTALEAAELAPQRAVEEAIAAGDTKIAAFNREMSGMNRDALADLWHTGDDHAYDVARAQMELRVSGEGKRTLAEAERLAKVGEEEAARLAEKIPAARDAFASAEKTFQESAALAQQRRDLEASWFGLTKNEGSHIWGPGKSSTPLLPKREPILEGPGYLGVKLGASVTAQGTVPRLVSGLERGISRELMPFSMEGRIGRWLDPVRSPLTSPAVIGIPATVGATAWLGGWAGRKFGLIPPPLQDQLVEAQNALDNAVKGGDKNAIETARKKHDDLKAKIDEKVGKQVTVEQAVTKHTLASVAQDYARTGDARRRDEVLATMDPEMLQAQLGEIRNQVFSIHNPGRSIEQLGKSDAGRQYIETFDRDVFGSKSGNDWLTTDLGAYQRDVESALSEEN